MAGTKVKVNISVTPDTAERLKKYAEENHTNVSQAITSWIWSRELKRDKQDKSGTGV